MDNHAQDFARKIISVLEDIKGLVHDAVSFENKEGNGPNKQGKKSTDNKAPSKSGGNGSATEPHPAASSNDPPAAPEQKSFPRLRKYKPVIEVAGVGVLVIYTGVTIALWLSSMESNRISRESLVSVQRAFVNFKTIDSKGVRDAKGRIAIWRFFPQWENTGATPTRRLRQHVNTKGELQEMQDSFKFIDAGVAKPDTPSLIAPKALIGSGPLLISPEAMILIKAGTIHQYFWGWAVYRDIFNSSIPHLTEFCEEMTVTDGDPITGEGINFLFTSCQRHNCSDTDCEDYAERTQQIR